MQSSNQIEEQYLEVQKIISKRVNINGSIEYKVLWKNYPISRATWEPILCLRTAQTAIQQYQQHHSILNHKQIQKPKQQTHFFQSFNPAQYKDDENQSNHISNQSRDNQKNQQNHSVIHTSQEQMKPNPSQDNNHLQVFQFQFVKTERKNVQNINEKEVIIIQDDSDQSDPDNYDEVALKKILIQKVSNKTIFKRRNKEGIRIKYTINMSHLLKEQMERQTQFCQQNSTNQKVKESPPQSQEKQ